MREWAERRGEVRVASVATRHFLPPRAEEWGHLLGMLSLLVSEDAGASPSMERWQYLGTFFHPHLGAWVHDLRYQDREDGPWVALRVPASERYRPPVDPGWVERRSARGPLRVELVVSAVEGRAFAMVVPVLSGPTVWRCVRESLFPAREEEVVLH